MPAYVIVDITNIRDESTYASYKSQVSSGIRAAGGTYLVRGGPVDVLEGDWRPGRVVVVRFDSAENARRWWSSADYEPLKRLRQSSAATNMILVDGLTEGVEP